MVGFSGLSVGKAAAIFVFVAILVGGIGFVSPDTGSGGAGPVGVVSASEHVDARINTLGTNDGPYYSGDDVTASVTIENTGSERHEFFVGYSVQGPDGNWYSNDQGTGQTVTLDSGETEHLDLDWTVPDDAPLGSYDTTVSVWQESDRDALETRLDRMESPDTFDVQQREDGCLFVSLDDEDGDDASAKVLLRGTTTDHSEFADTSDDSEPAFCNGEESYDSYMFAAPPGEYEVWVIDDGSPQEYWGIFETSITRGELNTLSLDRGGVYGRGSSIESDRGTRRFAPGGRAEVSAAVYNGYDATDSTARMELYVYESGRSMPENPTATIDGGSIDASRNGDITDSITLPDGEGTYEVVGHIETYLGPGEDYYLTDTVDFGEVTVEAFEPPRIESSAPDDGLVLTADADRSFSVDVSDSDTSTAELSYEWSVDGQTVGDGDSLRFDAGRYQGGTHTVRVVVSDGSSRTRDAMTEWTVEVVEPPTIIDLQPGNTEVATGDELTFSAAATDPGGYTPLSYEWSIDGRAFDGSEVEYTFESAGERTVDLRVTNTQGVTRSRSFTLDVHGPPTIQRSSPPESNHLLTPDEQQQFSVEASDPDTSSSDLRYEWSVDGDRVASEETFTFDASSYGSGEHTVSVRVSDGSRQTDDDAVQWSTRVVAPPTIRDVQPGNTEATIGEPVVFSASATDPGGYTPLSYEWSIDGQTFDGSSVERTFQSAGERSVELTVSNERGVSRTRTFTVDVESSPPDITSLSPITPLIVAGESVTVSAAAEDPSERDTSFRYEWSLGDENWNGREITVSPRTVGRHDLELTVTNDFGTETTETVTITVRNDQPTVERVSPGEATISPVAEQSRRFAVDVVDHDSQPVSVALSVDGQVVSERTVAEPRQVSFRRAIADPGDHTVEIDVTDDHGASTSTTWDLAVQSRPPEITSRSPGRSQLSLRSGNSTTFRIDARDPDGESLSYEWYVDDEFSGSGQSYNRTFDRHGQYSIRAVVIDASGSRTTHNWTVSTVSFRETPEIDPQLSSLRLDEQSGAETASVSVTNPSINQRSALVELILEVPDFVDVTGTGNVQSSSASQYRINDTIAPGEQESLSVHFEVDSNIEPGSTIDLDYSVLYRPVDNTEDISVVENDTNKIRIATATPSETVQSSQQGNGGEQTNGTQRATDGATTPSSPGQTVGVGPGLGAPVVVVALLVLVVGRRAYSRTSR